MKEDCMTIEELINNQSFLEWIAYNTAQAEDLLVYNSDVHKMKDIIRVIK